MASARLWASAFSAYITAEQRLLDFAFDDHTSGGGSYDALVVDHLDKSNKRLVAALALCKAVERLDDGEAG